MPALQFEWDEAKASVNAEKHGVTFEEASSVFGDPLARMLPDRDGSLGRRSCDHDGAFGSGAVVVGGVY